MNSKKARGPQTASPAPSPERLGRGCKKRMRSRGWPCPSGAGAPRAWPCACGRPPGICEGGPALHGMPLSPLRLASRRRAARAPSAGSRRFTWVRAMPCWRACGPARWGRRSSYGNGFAIFSRYVTEPRDPPSESSRPTPSIRLFALIRAIIPPWKGNSEPPSFATVIYRKFSSIPLPYPKRQGDAGGHRRAIAGLHRAVPFGMRGDPYCGPGEPPIDAPAARASQGGHPRACRRAGGTPRSSGRHRVPDLRKSRIR